MAASRWSQVAVLVGTLLAILPAVVYLARDVGPSPALVIRVVNETRQPIDGITLWLAERSHGLETVWPGQIRSFVVDFEVSADEVTLRDGTLELARCCVVLEAEPKRIFFRARPGKEAHDHPQWSAESGQERNGQLEWAGRSSR